MQQHGALTIPESLSEIIAPQATALLVYDMQCGIVPHIHDAAGVTRAVSSLVGAAHEAGVRVFASRHFSLPLKAAGVAQLRSAMAFQRVASPARLVPRFLSRSPEYQLVPEIQLRDTDVVFDKLMMSFFVGTPLEFCLRDLGIRSVVVAGCVAEFGVEPTVHHAADLGFIPVTVADGCGSLSAARHQETMDRLRRVGPVVSSSEILAAWKARGA